MTEGLSLEKFQEDLVQRLQERDLDRPLDSLEITVVQAYLVRLGVAVPTGSDLMEKNTIRRWVSWARRCSTDS